MVSVDLILNKIGERVTEELRNNIRNKKVTRYGAVNASGSLAKSVRYEVVGGSLRVFAWDYIYNLEYGRGPTKKNGDGELKRAIIKWIEVKNITPRDNISKDSLAFLIARKIHEQGTEIYKQGGTDLVSSIFNVGLVEEVNGMLTEQFTQTVVDSFRSAVLKEAA
jgi:hypothetical protein